LEELSLSNNQLAGQYFFIFIQPCGSKIVPSNTMVDQSTTSVMTLFSLDFVLSFFLVGELPLPLIKMKTEGVTVPLWGNTGFTLPLNMGELGNIEKLDLHECSLIGLYGEEFYVIYTMVNQSTTSFMTLL
jgi:hypothetical protein